MTVRLTAYRIYLFPISFLSLAIGFYLTYWKKVGPRWNRIVLWVATVLFALLWSLPYLLRTSGM